MKRIFTLMLVLFAAVSAFAQDRNNEDEVVKLDQWSRFNSVEGEVIVKFADNSSFRLDYDRNDNLRTTGMNSVDKAFEKFNVTSIRQLCPSDEKKRSFRTSKCYNGNDVVERDLSRLCLVKIEPDASRAQDADYNIQALTQELIDIFNAMEDVEFAEPNFIMYALGVESTDNGQQTTDLGYVSYEGDETRDPSYNYFAYKTYRKEPYYSQQWGISATNIDGLWQAYEDGLDEKPDTDRPVIAILDTGVDITHPDLEANIWTNPNEIGNNYDDDGNGFKDDIHGWDFVNKTGDVRDYNSHGTHCAGIAAAVGTNGKGVVGANPNAYIMPVTVMQSNGTGAISTIIEGINYAKNNGADIISMSIGTYAYSIALEQALAQAYQNSVLVAAAGNDGLNIDPSSPCAPPRIPHKPMYPASFTFVLGVQATQEKPGDCGHLACFSNYDCDGPSFSQYSEEKLYNYELQAPGAGIISTVPNGKYKAFNGTSMACPLVAGGISALLTAKEYPSQEMLWGDLINYSGNHVDFKACYEAGPAPAQLQMVTYQLNDTLGGDGDYRADAGETIDFYPTIRTTWGAAEDITYWLEFDEYEDDRTIEFIENDNIEFGQNLSAYAKSKAVNPVRFKVNEDVVDGRYINLVLKATCPNAEETLAYPFTVQVENGVEIGGMLEEDKTLYPDVHYIVTETIIVPSGVTLTILPGTVLRFKEKTAFVAAKGSLICNGTPEQPIVFTMAEQETGKMQQLTFNDNSVEYTIFENLYLDTKVSGSYGLSNVNMTNCIIRNCNNDDYLLNDSEFYSTNIFNNKAATAIIPGSCYIYNSNYVENNSSGNFPDYFIKANKTYNSNVFNNYMNDNDLMASIAYYSSNPSTYKPSLPCYLGTGRMDYAEKMVIDYNHPTYPSGYGNLNLSNMLTRPSSEAHGIVWKVLVNGKDAQDEFEEVVPLGVGRHKFEVYFNRAMDTSVVPFVAMGVRPPYTQNAIASDGSWSEDSTIYTVYLDLDASMVTDGLNRIYVANARDDEFFEIPFENKRFNVQVSAAGSMSAGFEATPGIGKVELVWENDSTYFNDHLGWNMYRYQKNERGNTDTILLNKEMITDTLFTDFDVVPGERYYYFYKVMRTNLTESDASRNVSTVPLTAQPGDANGSLKVDVIDIVSVVSYITGDNPQPFVFEAADVNKDGDVDVMDIVGIINIITSGRYESDRNVEATALYSIEDGVLYVDTPVELGGVQVFLNCDEDDDIEILSAMDKFEQVSQFMNDGRYLFMAYSLSGEKLAPGKHAILRIGNADVEEMILADAKGNEVLAAEETLNIKDNEIYVLNPAYPNPFNGNLNIPYLIGEASADVTLTITNITGQQVANINLGTQSRGEYNYEWQPKSDMPSGIYIINMYVNGNMMQRNKVVYMK